MVGVVSQAGEIAACRERGHIQCLQRQDVSPEGSGGVETDNVAGEHVSDERDIGEALPRLDSKTFSHS